MFEERACIQADSIKAIEIQQQEKEEKTQNKNDFHSVYRLIINYENDSFIQKPLALFYHFNISLARVNSLMHVTPAHFL